MNQLVVKKNQRVEFAVAFSLIALAPLLWMQSMALWEKPHFQFFAFAWAGFSWLVYANAKVTPTTSIGRRMLGLLFLALAILFAAVSGLKVSPWAAQVASILLLTGWGLVRLGSTPWTRLMAWSLLLWITVPLPLGYDAAFIQRLQLISSESSAHMLDLLGTPHLRSGNLIELQSGKLFVDEACSGVDSLYSLGAIAILIIVLQRTSLPVGFILLAMVPAWAWLGNMTRLTLIAWLLDTWKVDLSHGPPHTALGLATFSIAALSLFLTNHFLTLLSTAFESTALPRDNPFWHQLFNAFVGFPVGVQRETQQDVRRSPELIGSSERAQNRNGSLSVSFVVVATVFVIAGGFSVWTMRQAGATLSSINLPHFPKAIVDVAANEEAFPNSLAGAARVRSGGEERNPDNLFGEYSRYWTYVAPQGECLISLDFPFRGFHPLWVCYQGAGNTIVGTPQIKEVELQGKDWSFVELEMKDDLGNTSCLWFALFDEESAPLPKRSFEDATYSTAGTTTVTNRLGLNARGGTAVEPVTFQCQLLAESSAPLTTVEREKFRELFIAALPHAVRVSQAIIKKGAE